MAEESFDTHNTGVWRVIYNDGKNNNAIVFDEPVEGAAYHEGEMFVLRDSGSAYALVNDDGVIPYRRPSGDPAENLGVTWHFQK